MALPAWKDLSPLVKRSPHKQWEMIRAELNPANYTVSATCTDGTNPLAGVVVKLTSGENTYTGTTGSAGGCNITNVPAGTYTVTCTLTDYTYTPSTLIVNADKSENFVLTHI